MQTVGNIDEKVYLQSLSKQGYKIYLGFCYS